MATQLRKFADESRVYFFDFSPKTEIRTGATIQTVDSVTVDPSGLTHDSGTIFGSGVNVRLSGGTGGTVYHVSVLITTNGGDDLRDDLILTVDP